MSEWKEIKHQLPPVGMPVLVYLNFNTDRGENPDNRYDVDVLVQHGESDHRTKEFSKWYKHNVLAWRFFNRYGDEDRSAL